MVLKMLEISNNIKESEKRFMMVGTSKTHGLDVDLSEHPWVNNKMWCTISELTEFESFSGFAESFIKDIALWKELYDSESP